VYVLVAEHPVESEGVLDATKQVRLAYSSGAMSKCKSTSSELECVTKGLAPVPPGTTCNIGAPTLVKWWECGIRGADRITPVPSLAIRWRCPSPTARSAEIDIVPTYAGFLGSPLRLRKRDREANVNLLHGTARRLRLSRAWSEVGCHRPAAVP